MKDIIKRRLEAAKQQIEDLQKTVNKPVKEVKKTQNMVPAGVPEESEPSKTIEDKVPGYITGGPKFNKKMKEV